MFIVLLNYIQPPTAVDRFVEQHHDFLARYYASGHFLVSGRKEPRTGGIILARATTKAEIEDIIRQDPFHAHHIAEYEIIEFIPGMTAAGLETFKS